MSVGWNLIIDMPGDPKHKMDLTEYVRFHGANWKHIMVYISRLSKSDSEPAAGPRTVIFQPDTSQFLFNSS